ncbi:MAG: proteasome regulatory particle base subunit [Cirrosporium novae-zelandiae]|nr:MAG: proteasome regulatory particle base subunit [Cirrosporium novae-zelandiae]
MVGLVSAAGLVGFLSEPDPQLQIFALNTLNEQVDLFWIEVAGSVGQIEALYEDESFPERQLAALVASKVYYHLQAYNESMVFALGAGKLFNIDNSGEFEETIISKCIDSYIALSSSISPADSANVASKPHPQLSTSFPASTGATNTAASMTSPTTPFSQSTLPSKSLLSRQGTTTDLDPSQMNADSIGTISGATPAPLASDTVIRKQLQAVIERLFEKCFQEKRYRQVVGIAVEARNLDVLRRTILRATADEKRKGSKDSGDGTDSEALMEYVLDICMNVVQERGLRNEILRLILDLLNDIPSPDYFSIAKCVVYLNEHSMASDMLHQLVERGDPRSLAVAYQISFDLYDNSTQEFLKQLKEELAKDLDSDELSEPAKEANEGDNKDEREKAPESEQLLKEIGDSVKKNHDSQTTVIYRKIHDILNGLASINLELEFLYRNNHADMGILKRLRDSLEARNSIFHTAVTFANAFMHAGTTHDKFFRDNLEWLGKAVNWSKFTATAALGVIHRGNLSQGKKLLAPYLPKEQAQGLAGGGSAYSQGGSLYAYGLIYANHGSTAIDLIRKHFKDAQGEEVVQHGGALGLGVAGMGIGDEGIYEDLKEALYTDSALNGEAVGLAMGLIMLGSGNIKALEDMISYAHETQHEKTVRGLAMGMALIMYGRQEAADELIKGLLDDPDPTLRYGGIMTIALAYCGTGSNKAVRKLLHVAVSDVSDDVRRAAVMSLGFILFRKHSSVPRMVELLSESYNPHVRYGAAMALGISCAGTGLDEAVDLLEPMLKDPTDFVRQGALISLSMIMIQQNEAMNPKVGSVRKILQKIVSDRHEDAMAKFGAAIALGIIDAGGRNCTISLQTQTGNLNMTGIVGMAVFTQYWYWFPFTHFLSLSFTPTSIIGVDQNLDIPKFKFHSNTRSSLFDYPPEQETKADEAPEKVKTAVLSTTAQAKRRAQKKEKQARRESMDIDQRPTTPKKPAADADKMDTDEKDSSKKEDKEGETEGTPAPEGQKKKVEKEKVGYELENMSRVLPAQLKYLSFPDSRYIPIKKPTGGVVVVIDSKPDEPKDLIELKSTRDARAAAALEASERAVRGSETDSTQAQQGGEGAAAGVGVLTAVDEDQEGDEDAELPMEFDYYSDGGEEEDN